MCAFKGFPLFSLSPFSLHLPVDFHFSNDQPAQDGTMHRVPSVEQCIDLLLLPPSDQLHSRVTGQIVVQITHLHGSFLCGSFASNYLLPKTADDECPGQCDSGDKNLCSLFVLRI